MVYWSQYRHHYVEKKIVDKSAHIYEVGGPHEVDQSLFVKQLWMQLSIEHDVHRLLGYIFMLIFMKD